jgi:hypothetical protein
LREKVEMLAPFGLDWWLRELRPICDQFVRASEGDVDLDHWRRIYKVRAVYAAEVFSGWIGKLFPYIKDFRTGCYSHRNPLLDPNVEKEIRQLEAEETQGAAIRFSAPGITTECLPRGLSQVPFTLTERSDTRAMEFVAGTAAVTQDLATGALRPALGWAIRESAPIEQAVLQLAQHEVEPAKVPLSEELLRNFHTYYVPTDVLRFYQTAHAAQIHRSNGVALYRILPLAEWQEPEWARKPRIHSNDNVEVRAPELFRFAELSDGTELVIRLYCPDDKHTGAVFVDGRDRANVGRKVAQSFTDFLLRSLNSADEPYFRRADFESLE